MSELELLRAEVAFWQARAEMLETSLADLKGRIGNAQDDACEPPPEPPVGTVFVNPDTGAIVWAHHQDGWHCSRRGCQNCPEWWGEVYDRYVSTAKLRRELPTGAA